MPATRSIKFSVPVAMRETARLTMSNDENFREQVARLAERARESRVADLQNQCLSLDRELGDLWEQATEADNAGEDELAIALAKEAGTKAGELQQTLARLPQQPTFTAQELDYMGRRPDI